MNRPETALAALLLTIVAAVPAAAQQVSLPPQPMSEFCSGCFAYLEFPPLPEDGVPSIRASTHQDSGLVVVGRRCDPISDPRTKRRGLSRATLARDVCQACDSTVGC